MCVFVCFAKSWYVWLATSLYICTLKQPKNLIFSLMLVLLSMLYWLKSFDRNVDNVQFLFHSLIWRERVRFSLPLSRSRSRSLYITQQYVNRDSLNSFTDIIHFGIFPKWHKIIVKRHIPRICQLPILYFIQKSAVHAWQIKTATAENSPDMRRKETRRGKNRKKINLQFS